MKLVTKEDIVKAGKVMYARKLHHMFPDTDLVIKDVTPSGANCWSEEAFPITCPELGCEDYQSTQDTFVALPTGTSKAISDDESTRGELWGDDKDTLFYLYEREDILKMISKLEELL